MAHKNTEPEYLNDLYKEVLEEIRAAGIPYSPYIEEGIKINHRAKKRFGCCKKTRKKGHDSYEIEISSRLLSCDSNAIKQTLAHEILHTCKNCGNHGELWKLYAEKLNGKYGYNIKRTGSWQQLGIEEKAPERKASEEKYLIICENCGAEIGRSRMSKVVKYPSKYRCRCGGKLKRVK